LSSFAGQVALSGTVLARFCMGSNKVLQVALGRSGADEYGANLSKLSERIVGSVGLFFTKLPREEVGLLLRYRRQGKPVRPYHPLSSWLRKTEDGV